jgi:sucrose-6-phosphate hydrolase SacC (GH32 family)
MKQTVPAMMMAARCRQASLLLLGMKVCSVGIVSSSTTEVMMAPAADDAAPPPAARPLLILCKPSASISKWAALPTADGPPAALRLASHPTLCAVAGVGSLQLGSCAAAPKFSLVPSKHYPTRGYNIAEINATSGNATGACVDARGLFQAQLYKCVDSPNQGWNVNASTREIRETFDHRSSILGLSTDPACAAAKPEPRPPPPPARGAFCPKFHPIGGSKVFDPSGPLMDDSGRWHLYEDDGGWSVFWSHDLMNWQGTLKSSTHFSGLTGSLSPTPSGIYAFWPGRNPAGLSAVESAVCEDCTSAGGWRNWTHRGFPPGLVVPKREAAGSFRDPARAFLYEGSWYIGVGCGQSVHDLKNGGGAVCLFKATNDSLAEFTDAGTLYRTTHSHGSFGRTVQVYNRSDDFQFNMMECPDIFPLGDRWVLLGSIAHGGGPNQWWTGQLAGNPPRFTPDRVGILDYGYGYAAKSGSIIVQSGSSRRVVFGFTGWAPAEGWEVGHTTPDGGCGRFLVLPRELSMQSDGLHVDPVPETVALRSAPMSTGSATHGVIQGGAAGAMAAELELATGAQLEVHIVCTKTTDGGGSWPTQGEVVLRTLGSADGKHFTTVGWDFANPRGGPFFVDSTHCCENKSAIVQRALAARPGPGQQALEMRVWVDSGMIEAFSSGVVITALINPSVDAGGPPDARVSSVVNTARGVGCEVSSYQLVLNASNDGVR